MNSTGFRITGMAIYVGKKGDVGGRSAEAAEAAEADVRGVKDSFGDQICRVGDKWGCIFIYTLPFPLPVLIPIEKA